MPVEKFTFDGSPYASSPSSCVNVGVAAVYNADFHVNLLTSYAPTNYVI